MSTKTAQVSAGTTFMPMLLAPGRLFAGLLSVLIPAQFAAAQGTVIFANRTPGTLITHVYGPLPASSSTPQAGNATNDTPAGSTSWIGYTMVGSAGGIGAATTFAQLFASTGSNQPESALQPATPTTTFRTGGAAGNFTGATATLGSVPMDAAVATVQVMAWDNSSGLYPTWAEAFPAWHNGIIAAGKSPPFNVNYIGGIQNSSPSLTGLLSFNLYYGGANHFPYILVQPQSQQVAAGQNVVFTVFVSGSDTVTYQWRFGGADIPGATNRVFIITNAQAQHAGDYSVLISTPGYNVPSSIATLSISLPPSIATQPQSQTVLAGQTANFSVSATGADPLAYQWRFNGNNIAGATSTSFSITSAQTSNAGPYTVRVSNAVGSVTSSVATLTINVPPSVTLQPTNTIALVGGNALLAVAANGTAPLNYQWQLYGTNLPYDTNANLTLTNVQPANQGNYWAVVSNPAGSVTSAPALLDVRFVLVQGNGQLLLGTNYTYVGSVSIDLEAGYQNGSIFFTLDGSPPSFASAYFSGTINLSHSATLRTIAYSADFSQSGEAAPIYFSIIPSYTLSAAPSGGGTVSFNPPGGVYSSNTTVNVTASPAPGWSFIGWLGDVAGANPTINITMTRNKTVQTIFGTTLNKTFVGNGSVAVYPDLSLYPYGTIARLSAMPQSGSYFAVWGNAASGNVNPLYFTVTNANPTISSAFATLTAGQAALTVVPDGFGHVIINPRANAYAQNSSVTLTAIPDAGQSFLGWSGDASGTVNPLTILTTGLNQIITASFTRQPKLALDTGLDGMTQDGFRFTLFSEFGTLCQIDGSTNLLNWQSIGTLTNTYGRTQFTDPAPLAVPHRFYRAVQGP